MAFDISKFSAHLNKYGTIKNNRYEVIISPPRFFATGDYKEVFDIMPFRAENVNIPDINLNLLDVNRYGIGPRQRFPTNIQYPETISMSFLETEASDMHKFFTLWTNAIFQHINPVVYNRRGIYLAEYKENYSSLIEIKVFTDQGEGSISNIIELTDAFPSQVSASALGWGETNNLMRLNVNFAFTDIRFPLLNPQAFNYVPS